MKLKSDESSAAKQMWDNFIAHLNKTQPLLVKWKVEKGKRVMASCEPHQNFLGSVESYKKVFMEANNDKKSN